MPKRAWPGRSPKASRDRWAQRIDRRMEAWETSSVAGKGVHSSKAMTMSEPRSRWIAIEASGVSRWREPSMWLAKVTPFSVIVRSPLRLITWKPPESVRIGRSQFMKPWSPPSRATRSAPGRSMR